MVNQKSRRGRPKKFGRAARSVTLRLPYDVIERLWCINADLGRAVVSLVEREPIKVSRRLPAEVASYGSHSVILVSPVRPMSRLPGVQLVPVSNGRALIALEPPNNIPQFELNLMDGLEKGALKPHERAVFDAVSDILKRARRSHRVLIAERSIIVFEPRRRSTPTL